MGMFDFLGPTTTSPGTYPAMEARRRLALQLLSNSKKGYPKTIGEGLTAIGDAIGDRSVLAQLAAQEDAYGKAAAADAASGIPAEAMTPGLQSAAPAPAPAAKPLAYADTGDTGDSTNAPVVPYPTVAPAQPQVPVATSDLTPDEQKAGVVGSDVSVPDTATPPPGPQSAYRPAPAYLQASLERLVQDPERRGYLGQLASKEARSADEVSPTGAKGPFQFTRGTGRQYGLMGPGGDLRSNIDASIMAANKLTDDNVATLTARLGRPPTPGEMALAHQQGAVTAARMLSGAGNASGGNLAVNNVSPGASPQAAAAKIMGYYGMPGAGAGGAGGRDALAAAVLQQRQPPPQPPPQPPAPWTPTGEQPRSTFSPQQMNPPGMDVAPAGGNAAGFKEPNLSEVQPPGPQASAGPAALSFSGLAPDPGAPSGLPPEITGGASIRPAPQPPLVQPMPQPPPPPQQVAQATPAPASRPPTRQDVPMNEIEKQGWRELAKARASGDPGQMEQAKALLQVGIGQHDAQYNALMKDYQDQQKFDRERPEREANIARTQQQTQAGRLIDPTDKPYVLGPDGVARPLTVTGGGAINPTLTETQTKNLDYYQRGKRALADLGSGDELQNFIKWHAGGAPVVGNALVDAKYQEQLNAAKEFAAIVLRRESGAAVTANELSDVMQRYIPRPGDKPDLATQKEFMRNGVVDSLRNTLGKGSAIADKFDQNFPAERQRLQADKRQNVINADMEGVPKVEGVVKTNKKTGAKRMWDGTRWMEVP